MTCSSNHASAKCMCSPGQSNITRRPDSSSVLSPIQSSAYARLSLISTTRPHAPGILVLTLDGSLLRRITHPLLREARGFAFVRDHLVVTEYDTRAGEDSTRARTQLLCFTLSGELRQVVHHENWSSLSGCAVVGSGELYVVDSRVSHVRILQVV